MEAMVETKIKKEVSEDKLREKRAKKQGASFPLCHSGGGAAAAC